uniref:Uncharacterized protein n=1 Tax=Anopheles dirus TaxID=7168 RepID=A0A182NYB6_9DIPT
MGARVSVREWRGSDRAGTLHTLQRTAGGARALSRLKSSPEGEEATGTGTYTGAQNSRVYFNVSFCFTDL